MISTEQLKNVIEAKLNELSSEMPFEFLIHANMGEFKAYQEQGQRELPKPLINGVLVSLPSSIIPLQSIISYTATQLLTILAPQRPNDPQSGINDVLSVLQAFIESQAGFTGYLTDEDRTRYSYICTPQLPQVGQLGIEGVGFWHVPVSISLTWQFIAGGVISNSVKLKIDGVEAVLTDGSLVRTRIAQTNNKSNSQEMKSVIGQQGLTIKAIIPYMSDGNDASVNL